MQVGTWLDFLREISQESPRCRVMLIDEPPNWEDVETYQPEEMPVLQVSVDRATRQVTLHTEPDEDGPFLAPSPMLLSDFVGELERAADDTFDMFWVSGWQKLPEEQFDVEEDGEGPYRARLAVPLVAVGRHDDLDRVIFVRGRMPNEDVSQ